MLPGLEVEPSSQKRRPFLIRTLATCGGLAGLALAALVFMAFMSTDATRYYEVESNTDSRIYTFDPETLLPSLDRGETGQFTLQVATPEAPSQRSGTTYAWTQADFFRAARAVWQQGWGASFDELELYSAYFDVPCADVPRGGFNSGHFSSFKVIEGAEGSSRLSAGTWIDPGWGEVSTYRAEYTPDKKHYSPIDVEVFQVSAEDALKIAEASGGAGMRAIYRDDCKVSVMVTSARHPRWWVRYAQNRDKWWYTIFEVDVDPYTGEAKVTYPED